MQAAATASWNRHILNMNGNLDFVRMDRRKDVFVHSDAIVRPSTNICRAGDK